jgi:hypothetical protein
MKNGKKPTRAQKAALTTNNLNAENWLIERVGDGYIMVQHRLTGTLRKVATK